MQLILWMEAEFTPSPRCPPLVTPMSSNPRPIIPYSPHGTVFILNLDLSLSLSLACVVVLRCGWKTWSRIKAAQSVVGFGSVSCSRWVHSPRSSPCCCCCTSRSPLRLRSEAVKFPTVRLSSPSWGRRAWVTGAKSSTQRIVPPRPDSVPGSTSAAASRWGCSTSRTSTSTGSCATSRFTIPSFAAWVPGMPRHRCWPRGPNWPRNGPTSSIRQILCDFDDQSYKMKK